MHTIRSIQLGKQGITENFIKTLRDYFKNIKNVKISVLKSATRDKKEINNLSNTILDQLGRDYTSRVIGFTISIKKWRKNVR